jgi:hypothetical protein
MGATRHAGMTIVASRRGAQLVLLAAAGIASAAGVASAAAVASAASVASVASAARRPPVQPPLSGVPMKPTPECSRRHSLANWRWPTTDRDVWILASAAGRRSRHLGGPDADAFSRAGRAPTTEVVCHDDQTLITHVDVIAMGCPTATRYSAATPLHALGPASSWTCRFTTVLEDCQAQASHLWSTGSRSRRPYRRSPRACARTCFTGISGRGGLLSGMPI